LDFLTVFDRRKCGKQQPTRWHFRVKKAARKNLPQRFATSDYPTAKKPLQNLISGCFWPPQMLDFLVIFWLF
jgi:hypothetical protein